LASNFNDDPAGPPGEDPPVVPTPSEPGPAGSTGFVRFNSCRWQQPAEDGKEAFCTHREVKPYAGTTGFDADAWCLECQYYKLRRVPKKRNPDEYRY